MKLKREKKKEGTTKRNGWKERWKEQEMKK